MSTSRSQLLPVGLGAVLAALHCSRFSSPDHALDDAWISFRIARNLVEHGVLTFDLTQPPVEGMTNLLWTLLSAVWIAALPDLDPVLPARLLGVLLHVGTVVLAVRLVQRWTAARAPAASSAAATVTAVLLGASGSMAFWAMSGLETPLWTFLAVLAVERLQARAFLVAGLGLGLLAATRPEGVLAGGMLVLGALALDRRRGLATAGIFGLCVAAMEAFRWLTYGALLPNTFHAKAPDLSAGLDYVGGFWLVGLGMLGPLAVLPALRSAWARALLLAALVMLAGAAWSGGDWMPGFRRCSLALLVLAGLSGAGLALARGNRERVLVGVGALAWLGGSLAAALSGLDAGLYQHDVMAALGKRAAATPGVDTVALVDIGRFGWEFEGSIVDLVGLTDAHLASLPGAHADKPWDEAWFRSRDPDLLIVRSETPIRDPLPRPPSLGRPELGMVRSVLDNGGYRMHTVLSPTAGQWLMVFGRDGLVLPEGLWGPAWEKDLPRLLGEMGGG